ncbi:restriction endonuclease subunit S [Bifidobacterium pseudocatenulatum]|uniref:restriction endonuclease subunit S n=1 Tax=Bifidobacterium pseudocatenulatum TaxID=28026 RepID=UPI00232F8F7E|nr:restriction endonuclease subunit S [Bifidobacterium pseudocatenulatum]MDB6508516.1 restriction endonuclease subunit S [Bifidobacterium pseudocatenulatum]
MACEQVTLQDVCELIVDCPHTSAKDEGVGYPLIRTPNVGRGRLILTDVHRVSQDVYERRVSRAVPRQGDLILAREAPAGNVAIVSPGIEVCLGQRTMLLRPDSSFVVPEYLNYYLNAPEQRDRMLRLANGATVSHINVADIRNMPVQLPSCGEQSKVAELLNVLDDKIDLNNRLNDYLFELVSSVFAHRFSDNVNTTELKNVLSISTKALKPQEHADEIWEHYSIPAFDEKHRPIFEPASGIKSNKYQIDSECILISKLNPSTKRIWMPCCSSNNAVCSTEFIVYRPYLKEYKSFYYAAIDSPRFTDYLLEHVSGSTGSRQRAQPKDTLNYLMPNPDNEEIKDFCTFADPIYRHIQINEQQTAKLELLRETLLPKLMSGAIDVSKVDLTQLTNNHLADC